MRTCVHTNLDMVSTHTHLLDGGAVSLQVGQALHAGLRAPRHTWDAVGAARNLDANLTDGWTDGRQAGRRAERV